MKVFKDIIKILVQVSNEMKQHFPVYSDELDQEYHKVIIAILKYEKYVKQVQNGEIHKKGTGLMRYFKK